MFGENCQGFRWNEVWDPVSYDFFLLKTCKGPKGAYFRVKSTAPVSPTITWVVVSNIFYFHPYLGKIPIFD